MEGSVAIAAPHMSLHCFTLLHPAMIKWLSETIYNHICHICGYCCTPNALTATSHSHHGFWMMTAFRRPACSRVACSSVRGFGGYAAINCPDALPGLEVLMYLK